MNQSLTEQELLFCRLAAGGNPEAAAVEAGYPRAAAPELLERPEILQEIGRGAVRPKDCPSPALSRLGYERLAFGSIADAVKLLYMEEPSAGEIDRMDFFPVSEIRRPKDGAMEIKFFDRLQALERLELSEQQKEETLSPFYQALEQGGDALLHAPDDAGKGNSL